MRDKRGFEACRHYCPYHPYPQDDHCELHPCAAFQAASLFVFAPRWPPILYSIKQ